MTPSLVERLKESTAQQRYALNKPTNLVASITYGNASTTDAYTGNSMSSPRAGANAQLHASLPMRAQITVRAA